MLSSRRHNALVQLFVLGHCPALPVHWSCCFPSLVSFLKVLISIVAFVIAPVLWGPWWVQVIHCLFMTETTTVGGNGGLHALLEKTWWLGLKLDDKCTRRIRQTLIRFSACTWTEWVSAFCVCSYTNKPTQNTANIKTYRLWGCEEQHYLCSNYKPGDNNGICLYSSSGFCLSLFAF